MSRHTIRFALALSICTSLAVIPASAEELGQKIYRQQCISCHGENGDGTDDYPVALTGDKSIIELTELITQTMPEDDPEACAGDDAKAVATYIYNVFYSPAAQSLREPARIELSRLTVRQHRNALTDLIGSFHWQGRIDDERGLNAHHRSGGKGKREEVKRTEAVIDFDYGDDGSPDPKIKPETFSSWWSGGLYVTETGLHEIIVESDNSVEVWFNGEDIINARVRSGDQTRHSASVFLLGDRVYPIRLSMTKRKESKTAGISLRWKRPGRIEEVIPSRHLSPNGFHEVFVSTISFPPDDRSTGFIRGSSVSKGWYQAVTWSAIEAADYVVDHLDHLAGTKSDAKDRDQKLKKFAHTFVERALRTPLSDQLRTVYVDRQFDIASAPEIAIKRIALLTLTSPRFLYRETVRDGFDQLDVASWLAFGLWDSLPDDRLRQAAAKGELSTEKQIRDQIWRMLYDPRAAAKQREFMHQWLGIDRMHDLAKDPRRFPEFDEQFVADLETSFEYTLDEFIRNETPDFKSLFRSDAIHMNARLAKVYGGDVAPDDGFKAVPVKTERHAGVLTHPYLLSGLAYYDVTSPIHRGVLISRHLLGRTLKPPPEAVSPLAPDLHPNLTTRERVAMQTEAAACATCHNMINPLGFALEQYDAIGRFRERENDQPVNATGHYRERSGELVKFNGAVELSKFLVESEEVHEAFVEQMFHHLTRQPVQAFGKELLPNLTETFRYKNHNVRELMVEALLQSTLRVRDQINDSAETVADGN